MHMNDLVFVIVSVDDHITETSEALGHNMSGANLTSPSKFRTMRRDTIR
jgi:hypothetical protein